MGNRCLMTGCLGAKSHQAPAWRSCSNISHPGLDQSMVVCAGSKVNLLGSPSMLLVALTLMRTGKRSKECSIFCGQKVPSGVPSSG